MFADQSAGDLSSEYVYCHGAVSLVHVQLAQLPGSGDGNCVAIISVFLRQVFFRSRWRFSCLHPPDPPLILSECCGCVLGYPRFSIGSQSGQIASGVENDSSIVFVVGQGERLVFGVLGPREALQGLSDLSFQVLETSTAESRILGFRKIDNQGRSGWTSRTTGSSTSRWTGGLS